MNIAVWFFAPDRDAEVPQFYVFHHSCRLHTKVYLEAVEFDNFLITLNCISVLSLKLTFVSPYTYLLFFSVLPSPIPSPFLHVSVHRGPAIQMKRTILLCSHRGGVRQLSNTLFSGIRIHARLFAIYTRCRFWANNKAFTHEHALLNSHSSN